MDTYRRISTSIGLLQELFGNVDLWGVFTVTPVNRCIWSLDEITFINYLSKELANHSRFPLQTEETPWADILR